MLKGLGVSANYSYATSKARSVNPDNRYENPPLLRQSPNQWNLSPTYDRGPLSIRVGLGYNGPFIFQYQYTDRLPDGTPNVPPGGLRGPSGDIYQYSHFQVDAQGSYAINGGFKFIAAAVNLNNEPWGFYVGSKQFVLQREYYKPTYTFGIRWDMEHAR